MEASPANPIPVLCAHMCMDMHTHITHLYQCLGYFKGPNCCSLPMFVSGLLWAMKLAGSPFPQYPVSSSPEPPLQVF